MLRARPTGERIGIVASGGLTHFAVDEDLDREVIHAMQANDAGTLCAMPYRGLRSGQSGMLSWIMAAGALAGLLALTESEYVPVHRTPAGTGIGGRVPDLAAHLFLTNRSLLS